MKTMREGTVRNAVFAGALLTLAGCGGMGTKTNETVSSYAIYDIKPAPGVTAGQIGQAIKGVLQKNMSSVQINSGIPPSPLPEQPGRFQLRNPFKGSNLAALTGNMQMPTCDNAMITATSQDSAMAKYGEKTAFFLCVLPYTAGYHVDMYMTFQRKSGAFSTEALGATLMRPFVGDSSQFIPRTVKEILAAVEQAGATTSLVEQYP